MDEFAQFFSILPRFNDLKILVVGEASDFVEKIANHCQEKSIEAKFVTNYKKLIDREFEIAIVLNIVDFKTYKDCYHSLENSGNIIIVLEKSNFSPEKAFEILEEVDYRASNLIDIFANYYVITAKKMHMWGNGF